MDAPALYSQERIFAVRTMFWWGHFFSFTLHLQGTALQTFASNIEKNKSLLSGQDLYWCIGPEPWDYHYEAENYKKLEASDLQYLKERSFIKISKKLPLDQSENLDKELVLFWKMLCNVLQ